MTYTQLQNRLPIMWVPLYNILLFQCVCVRACNNEKTVFVSTGLWKQFLDLYLIEIYNIRYRMSCLFAWRTDFILDESGFRHGMSH